MVLRSPAATRTNTRVPCATLFLAPPPGAGCRGQAASFLPRPSPSNGSPLHDNRPKVSRANWKPLIGRRAYPAHRAHRAAVAVLQHRGPAIGAFPVREAFGEWRAAGERGVAWGDLLGGDGIGICAGEGGVGE